ncbi:hypothetical protein KOI35_24060 [Actinoplanes bogorensis]|uniref:Uncharacterized protein n=1 Tax=Paractinoplanes bogorensis TaxID=1610840 RepID=A0ABS5YT14_9ACTN|nr:hypothetical protein [Actinoplanes bogorensis]MBU2666587.1 hypothetical protein [Actinoplanes bogorensis]
MTWSTSTDAAEFLDAAGAFLRADPVANTMLLTEAAYLRAYPADDDRQFGWWTTTSGEVTGALLRAARHAPIVSRLPDDAWGSLPDFSEVGIDARDLDRATATWPTLSELFRVTICRPPSGEATGPARRAGPDDRDLLVAWFHDLMAAHPGDPSDLTYVVDFPLTYGGLTLTEVDGTPAAMAGRTPVIAGMTRVGAAYAPDGDTTSVLAAAYAEAATVATDVLVLTTKPAPGQEQCGQRITLRR